jgi:sulfite reductase (ferredoxin)
VMLGGKWAENGGSYALALGAIPSKKVPELVDRITQRYVTEKQTGETFQAFCQRVGKKALKAMIDEFTFVPPHDVDATFYSDWGDPRQFSIGDMGTGECAGEVVSHAQFGFTHAETEAFEAQLLLDSGSYRQADEKAYHAMIIAARTLVQLQWPDVPGENSIVVNEFVARFVDTKIFWDTYHAGQFANYLINRHEGPDTRYTKDTVHKLVEEANLFIDAAYKASAKYQQQQTHLLGGGVPVMAK